jgi:uncharacterized protein YpmB
MKKALQIAIGVNIIFVLLITVANGFALDEKTTNEVKQKLEQAQKLVDEAFDIMALEEQEAADERNAIENDLP